MNDAYPAKMAQDYYPERAGQGPVEAPPPPLTDRIGAMLKEAQSVAWNVQQIQSDLLLKLFGPSPQNAAGTLGKSETTPSFEGQVCDNLRELIAVLAQVREQAVTLQNRI